MARGVSAAADLAARAGCRAALLKLRSPTCGVGRIYDGTFSGKLIPGDGMLAARLREWAWPCSAKGTWDERWASGAAPLLYVVAGSVMISFSAVFVKWVSVSPDTAGFYRGLFGGLALAILALARRTRLRPGRKVLALLFGAAVSLSLDLVAWHRSIALVGPGLATILINFQVFVLALWGRAADREPLPGRVLLAIPLALAGLWLLVGADWTSGPGYGGEWSWAYGPRSASGPTSCLIRVSQSVPERLDAVSNMALASLGTAAVIGLLCLARGQSLAVAGLRDGFWLAAYGLVSQGLGWLLISRGLPHLPAWLGGITILIMPTLSFVWDILFFGRPTGVGGFCGALLALGGIWLGVSGRGRAPGVRLRTGAAG